MNVDMDIDLLEKELEKQGKKSRAIIFIASLALLFFLGISIIFPFKNQILNRLYPKSPSQAAAKNLTCSACRADIDKNGVVGQADYTQLSLCLGKNSYDFDNLGHSCEPADINGDGIIDNQDLQCLTDQFGQICGN